MIQVNWSTAPNNTVIVEFSDDDATVLQRWLSERGEEANTHMLKLQADLVYRYRKSQERYDQNVFWAAYAELSEEDKASVDGLVFPEEEGQG